MLAQYHELITERDQLLEGIRELVEVLRGLEWSSNAYGTFTICPSCGAAEDPRDFPNEPPGHTPDCALNNALAKYGDSRCPGGLIERR